MNNMGNDLGTLVEFTAIDDERSAIAAVIRAETQAFHDYDFDAWAACWIQDERTQDVYVSETAGLSVVSGWPAVSAHMQNVFVREHGCQMGNFRQDNLRHSISHDTAWAVFEGWSENPEGVAQESFETRILERQNGAWKIVYASFVMKHDKSPGDKTLMLDKEGRVIQASEQSLQHLKQHPIFRLSAGRVRANRKDWDKALQQALVKAGRYHGHFEIHKFVAENGGHFQYPAILGPTDEGGIAVAHLSVRDCVTYLQLDSEQQIDRRLQVAQAVFGLSNGQMNVARRIAAGESLKCVANTLGISVNTARTHLARLYDKTGVKSQTALVRLLLSVG